MARDDSQPDFRVVYVGSARRPKFKLAFYVTYEDERIWRERLATEMEDVCRELVQQGLHLTHVVPVKNSADLRGGWTEGAWLYFATS